MEKKVTTYCGFHIHQGKARCSGGSQAKLALLTQDRQGGVTARLSTTVLECIPSLHLEGKQSSSLHNRMSNITCPAPGSTQRKHQEEHPQEEKERNHSRNPESCGCMDAWSNFETSLVPVLQSSPKGSLASKLKLSGHILYEEGSQRLGTKPKRRTRLKEIGRRERVIDQLVKVHCLLRKSWRKAKEEEREALKNVWEQIKSRHANLRRAESIRKRRGWKEKARASFPRDPVWYVCSLLEEDRSETLRTTEQELEGSI